MRLQSHAHRGNARTVGGPREYVTWHKSRIPTGMELDELRAMGEVGQAIAGIICGFTVEEVAAKRGWDGVTTTAIRLQLNRLRHLPRRYGC